MVPFKPVTMAALALLLASVGVAAPVSTARVAFDAQAIRTTAVSGIADKATARGLTADDPVRWASVSKLTVGLAVLRLAERGKLDLDRDASVYLGYPLRHLGWPDIPITLRMLLSHTSGLRDDADYAIPFGQTVRDRLKDRRAWDADHQPGSYFKYSNLNFPVVASVIEQATGERFDKVMAREVFGPLRLDACFNWMTCTDAKVARAAVLYDATGFVRRDDLTGKRPDCPVNTDSGCDLSTYVLGSNGALFSPQGGMRASVRDVAAIGRMILNGGRGYLKPASFAQLTRPVWTFDGANGDIEGGFYCSYGLAVQFVGGNVPNCGDDLFGDGRPRMGHAGEAFGLRSGLWLDLKARAGVAFFATAVPDAAPKGTSAYTAVEERLARGR